MRLPPPVVTDLGTAFGIQLDETGASEVSVFDGQVDVAVSGTEENQHLTEGQAIRVSDDRTVREVKFDTKPFEKLWPVSSGIKGSSGAFRFRPPWPRKLRLVRSNSHIFVLPNGYRTILEEPLHVNISKPGKYRNEARLTPSTIPAGTFVRSFLLHFHPEKVGPRSRIEGSITFDRPVLGLIVLHQELAASKKLLSPHRVEEVREGRQLELTGIPAGDRITLHNDGHTVELSLAVHRRSVDLVRVILDDQPYSVNSTEDPNDQGNKKELE